MPPRRFRSRLGSRLRAVAVLVALAAATTGCATVSALNGSARALDTYALNPLPASAAAGRSGARIVFVADPTAPAAVASDRIVIKPNALQVTLVGDGRWVEAAPAHVRTLLARSLANTGRYALVTTGTVGPLPDFTVMTDIDGFEARLLPEGSPRPQVVVAMTLGWSATPTAGSSPAGASRGRRRRATPTPSPSSPPSRRRTARSSARRCPGRRR